MIGALEGGRAMSLTIRALHPLFGAELVGLDLERVDDTTFGEIVAAFDEHSVLLFRGQTLTDDEQIAFSARFGPLEATIRSIASRADTPIHISNLSNVDGENRLIPSGDKRNLFNAGNQMWHSDSSFKKVPAHASLLSAREVPPEGGETQFASMRVAYGRLPADLQTFLEDKIAVHSFVYSRGLVDTGLMPPDHAAQVPPVRQALVRVNPANGRKAFYVGSHACEIAGMPTAEARALLRELREAATRPELVYTHRWQVGDLVMWDNRCTLHRGRPWDESRYRRVMHRTTVAGVGPTAPDEPATVSPARAEDVAWGRAQLELV
jgi:alpha-ketoglutarate-dependent 2,4-dichlorophenoxyacetate dioxygenase